MNPLLAGLRNTKKKTLGSAWRFSFVVSIPHFSENSFENFKIANIRNGFNAMQRFPHIADITYTHTAKLAICLVLTAKLSLAELTEERNGPSGVTTRFDVDTSP